MLLILFSGCSKEPPKCSDEGTISLVRQIVIKKLAGNIQISNEDARTLLKLEMPRASAYDEKIRKYTCEARLISGDSYQVNINYESQIDDNDQHIVSVFELPVGYLIALQTGLAIGLDKIGQMGAGGKIITPATNQSAEKISANNEITGSWHGEFEGGEGAMEVVPAGENFHVQLSLSTPSGCVGSFDGIGSLTANVLALIKKENDETCSIKIEFSGNAAEIQENNCYFYHGAQCSFDGTLKKR